VDIQLNKTETIAAIATAPGKGGVGIVRVSGPNIESLCYKILGKVPDPRTATVLPILDDKGSIIDRGIAIFYPAPRSYTGESILEYQGHGGRVVLDMILQRFLSSNTRMARPGEFTERAFLNGKIDLTQAEAVADLIDASTEQAVRSAQNAIQGLFSEKVNEIVNELIELRTYVEASIDFVDENIDFLSDGGVERRLIQMTNSIESILKSSKQGFLLREGMTVVIAGKPNSGKSTLLNFLAGREAAIVTDKEGTTRDILRESITIDGMPLHIIDTAGLRNSEDEIEKEGIRRAKAEIEKADRILWVVDHFYPDLEHFDHEWFPKKIPVTRIYNKIDLTIDNPHISNLGPEPIIYLSLKTGAGTQFLNEHLKESMGYRENVEDVFNARRRHINGLINANISINSAQNQLNELNTPELIAEDLRVAQQILSEITGEFTTEDLLGKIFSGFCIGK